MRELLVFGTKTFKLRIPDDARVTFGPWSPASTRGGGFSDGYEKRSNGTLRVYGKGQDILGCFSDVTGFRDTGAVEYIEQVAKEEGAIIWKSDKDGYQREEKVKREEQWVEPKLLPAQTPPRMRKGRGR